MILYCERCGGRVADNDVVRVAIDDDSARELGVCRTCAEQFPPEARTTAATRAGRSEPRTRRPTERMPGRVTPVPRRTTPTRRTSDRQPAPRAAATLNMVPAALIGLCVLIAVAVVIPLAGRTPASGSDSQSSSAGAPSIHPLSPARESARSTPDEITPQWQVVRQSLDRVVASSTGTEQLAELKALNEAARALPIDPADPASAMAIAQLRKDCEAALAKSQGPDLFVEPLPADVLARARLIHSRMLDLGPGVPGPTRQRVVDELRAASADLQLRIARARVIEHPSVQPVLTQEAHESLRTALLWLETAAGSMAAKELFAAVHATALARLSIDGRDMATGKRYLDRAVQLDATFLPARLFRAYLMMRAEDNAGAATDFMMVVDNDPALPEDCGVNAANCLRMIGQLDKSIEVCDRVLQKHPGCWRAHVNRAFSLVRLKDDKAAGRADFRAALETCNDATWRDRIRKELADIGDRGDIGD
ncbi:MAG: tetratricopeptide repeat protein [Planctomycetota bacterium]